MDEIDKNGEIEKVKFSLPFAIKSLFFTTRYVTNQFPISWGSKIRIDKIRIDT